MRKILKTISPIDGSIYVERELANPAHIARTVAMARGAQNNWKATSIQERAALCKKAVDFFVSQKDDIALELCWQMGRPIRYGAGEVSGLQERAEHMISIAADALSPVQLPEKQGVKRWIKREALGTIFVIAPWNYPFLTAINAIMPAIMAGNTVILKHSAQTPLCAERFAEAFASAGLPEGVFQYLHLSHKATEELMRTDAIDYVAFTGSVAGGDMVEKAIAGRFIDSGLELGGKDPAYVRADADVNHAAETSIDGAFFNSGQSCCGIERLYVHEHVYDSFVEKAVALVKQYKLGRSDDPETTLGPMVRTAAADFVRGQIADAITQGAVPHITADEFPLDEQGTPYLAPQVLTNVNHSMRIMREESFGPVIGIQKVSSDTEAIDLMNDSEFGLTAAVFTRDIDTGITIGEQLETGTFFLNRCDYLDPALPWTGAKNSGRGCTLSKLGYESLTRPKSFHIKTD